VKANRKFRLIDNNLAYTKVVGGLVALLLTIIIGVLVFWNVSDSITMESAEASESKNRTTEMAKTVLNLLPIVAIVVVAAIILGVVLTFGGKPGG